MPARTTITQPESAYESSLSLSISASATSIAVVAAPVLTTGYLVIEPKTSNAEIIKYTGKTGNTLTGVTRGLAFSGSSDADAGLGKAHPAGAVIACADVHFFWTRIVKAIHDHEDISGFLRGAFTDFASLPTTGNIDGDLALAKDTNVLYRWTGTAWTALAAPVSPSDASSTVKGISKLSVDPAVPTNPIAVGDNDSRLVGLPIGNQAVPTGTIMPTVRRSAPPGYLLCDGSNVSRTTFADLFAAIAPSAVFTVTIASPAVFTKIGHGLVVGDKISITTTGALPTGLAVNTDYFVISAGLTADEFRVSTTRGGAAVNTSGTQSGTHTYYVTNYGKGDGATTFGLPDMRGFIPVGRLSSDANFDVLNVPNNYVGAKTHQLTVAELAAHVHAIGFGTNPADTRIQGQTSTGNPGFAARDTGSEGGNAPHNNLQPYVVVNYIIRT